MQWVLLCRDQPGLTAADRAAALLTLISNTAVSTAGEAATGQLAGWSSSWLKAEGALLDAAGVFASTQQGVDAPHTAGLQVVRSAVSVLGQRDKQERQAQQLLSKMRVSALGHWAGRGDKHGRLHGPDRSRGQ